MNNMESPVVVIFGAGATSGAFEASTNLLPPPIDRDFFDTANKLGGRATQKLAKRVLKSVWDLYGKTNRIGLETYYRDIETRGIIGDFTKTDNRPRNWVSPQKDMKELIRRVYIQTTSTSTDTKHEGSKFHTNILRNLKKGDSIVTFNYDLLIEESFESARLWNPIDGYGLKAYGKTKEWYKKWIEKRKKGALKKSKVPLFKLHGSFNWVVNKNKDITLKARPYYLGTRNKSGHEPTFEKVSILAPGWNKPIDERPFSKFWDETRRRLEQCKTLVILGYSLPETDFQAGALFAEIVRAHSKRKTLKQLHIAEPNELVKERFVELFIPALGATGKIFRYKGIREFSESLPSVQSDQM